MNAPWGITQAPSDFGAYSHNILVGQFGSGQILVFDPVTGHLQGNVERCFQQSHHHRRAVGHWFGSGGHPAGDNPVFTAGLNHEADGLSAPSRRLKTCSAAIFEKLPER